MTEFETKLLDVLIAIRWTLFGIQATLFIWLVLISLRLTDIAKAVK